MPLLSTIQSFTTDESTLMKHHIPGKDAALEDSIQHMQQQLHDIGFDIEEHAWLNPIPDVWSVHIRDKNCPMLFTNGKGKSKLAALASALGEFFERLNCNYFFADYYLGKDIAQAPFVHYPNEVWFDPYQENVQQQLMDERLWGFYEVSVNEEDGLTCLDQLIDINSGNPERGICALPFTRQRDQKTVYIPANIIGNLYVSNGMSAGNSMAEARVQALSEIFERWVKFKVIAEGLCLPDIPDAVLSEYPSIMAGVNHLREAGYEILLKDASLGGQYPVINVTLINPKDQGCYASFGAHPQFYVALERTLTELLQGRALEALGGFSAPELDLDEVASHENLETHFIDSSGSLHWHFFSTEADYDFVNWDFGGTTDQEFKTLCDKMHHLDTDIYIADYQHLGMYGCRIIVPSLSEIYAVDDLRWDNNNAGLPYREILSDIEQQDETVFADLLDALDQQQFDDAQPVAALIGLVPDSGSHWDDLRIGELKLKLALACKSWDVVIEYCEWVRHFAQLPKQQLTTYFCLENLLHLHETEADIDHYNANLKAMFGEAVWLMAHQWLKGENVWQGLESLGDNFESSKKHQQLLKAYDKLQTQKRLHC